MNQFYLRSRRARPDSWQLTGVQQLKIRSIFLTEDVLRNASQYAGSHHVSAAYWDCVSRWSDTVGLRLDG